MPAPLHASHSLEQQSAEQLILAYLNTKLGLRLAPARLVLSSTVQVQLDGLDEKNLTICEIYARIGILRGSQPDKAASDILKMELVERIKGGRWRKIFCFADGAAANILLGKSWLAAAAQMLGVEVEVCELPPEIKNNILAAQARQFMVNKIITPGI